VSSSFLSLVCVSLHHQVTFVLVHPGHVATEMGEAGGRKAPLSVQDAVSQTLANVILKTGKQVGAVVQRGCWRGRPGDEAWCGVCVGRTTGSCTTTMAASSRSECRG
jgi:hypothetical protein